MNYLVIQHRDEDGTVSASMRFSMNTGSRAMFGKIISDLAHACTAFRCEQLTFPLQLDEVNFQTNDNQKETSMTPYEQVKSFMKLFKQATPDEPVIPDYKTRLLRSKLIMEEAIETVEALGFLVVCSVNTKECEPNMEKILDGLCDLDYVARCGTAIACGLSEETIKLAQDEVHRSNMSKLWNDTDLAFKYKDENPGTVMEDYGGGLLRLVRPDGKVVKSPSYTPPDLKRLLQ